MKNTGNGIRDNGDGTATVKCGAVDVVITYLGKIDEGRLIQFDLDRLAAIEELTEKLKRKKKGRKEDRKVAAQR